MSDDPTHSQRSGDPASPQPHDDLSDVQPTPQGHDLPGGWQSSPAHAGEATPGETEPQEVWSTAPQGWTTAPGGHHGAAVDPPTPWSPPPGLSPTVQATSPIDAHTSAVLQTATEARATAALGDLFSDDRGTQRMLAMLRDPDVYDVRANRHDRVFYTDQSGPKMVTDRIFAGPAQFEAFLNHLLSLTDVGYRSVDAANASVIEGSFRADLTDLQGSLFIATSEVTRGEPSLVVRKQPKTIISLDRMLEQGMMSTDMRLFLELAVRGRANMLISGGSGAGKTTLARALSWFIDPSQRVVTVEEIDELHLSDRLPDVVPLTTFRKVDEWGTVRRSEDLEALVRHALRMRADRIWVGETRGKEAAALVKSCLSGHDGSVTTVHANNAGQAIRQLVSYVMESHLTEEVARDQVAAAFHLAVQVSMVRLGRRAITEIVELEPVREGNEQRRNVLWRYDFASETFMRVGVMSTRLRNDLERHNVNLAELDAMTQASWAG
jgi:Flp pilus assembly CpaF family ATPase